MERPRDDDFEPVSVDPADFPDLSVEPEHVPPGEIPEPPNDLEGPDEEPPHLERGGLRPQWPEGYEDPSPNVP